MNDIPITPEQEALPISKYYQGAGPDPSGKAGALSLAGAPAIPAAR